MARVAPPLPVSPKLFRHFAVITVVVTACVAMFADGEGREAIAAQVAERQKQNELLVAEAKTVGQRTIGLKKIKASKGAVALANASIDDFDTGGEFGAPMESAGGLSSYGDSMPSSPGPHGQIADSSPLSVLPPHARQTKRPTVAKPKRPSQEQLQQLMDASSRRSGASASSSD